MDCKNISHVIKLLDEIEAEILEKSEELIRKIKKNMVTLLMTNKIKIGQKYTFEEIKEIYEKTYEQEENTACERSFKELKNEGYFRF